VAPDEKGAPVAEAGEVYSSTPSTGTGGSGSEDAKAAIGEKGRKLGPYIKETS